MIEYIVCFLISVFLIYYAESKKFLGKLAKLAVGIALVLPCMLAALRNNSIGTDVMVYAKPLFLSACESVSIFDYYSMEFYVPLNGTYSPVTDLEIGYSVLTYLIAKIFNSFPVLLFTIQLLTIVPVYHGLRAFSKTQPVWLGMVVYYLMFYNQTMNVMRQWIAMAFLFYGLHFLRARDYRRYFLCMFVGVLFHNSAVIGLIVFAVYRLVSEENSYNKKVKTFLLVAIGIIGILSLDVFVAIMDMLGIRYGNYISGDLNLMPNQFLYRLPLILLLILRWKYLKRVNRQSSFYVVMLAYDLIASQLVSIFAQSARVAVYFNSYYILAYPGICAASTSKKNRQAMKWFVIAYLCIYWWYLYVFKDSSATVPYVSIFG